MQSQKYENLLNTALETPENERVKSLNLNVGYEEETGTWDVIVTYNGNLKEAAENLDPRIQVTLLLGGYAVLNVPEERMNELSALREIEFVEKPKRLYFAVDQARRNSCINPVQTVPLRLSGKGTCVAILDSGLDYTHLDFRNEDGSTRILSMWDQTLDGTPPQGYPVGREFSREEINQALQDNLSIGTYDNTGHGTAVAGIAVSNGRSSNGRYRGVATEAELIVVKLGTPRSNSFPRTTELMMAVDYALKKAMEFQLPLAINISFGNNYGSHDGTSLLETFLDSAANVWKTVICVGAGNEGNVAGHKQGRVAQGTTEQVEFIVGPFESTINIQIWKNYADIIDFTLITPTGKRITFFPENLVQRFSFDHTELLVYFGEPRPYSVNQEIYLDFLAKDAYIDSGSWIIEMTGVTIKSGMYYMWLPSAESLNTVTSFLRPSPYLTMTIPSTARKVISVAAYNDSTDSYADFSGRGLQQEQALFQKPDLAAPGVDITTTVVGGGYAQFSGTSFATPFVTGAASLLMQYGIVDGRDAYLYGEKVKAWLIKGARRLPSQMQMPDALLGWGALCLTKSIPV